MIIDCFAGGGGASQGIEEALGRPCDVAVNHDPKAIAMHQANHPRTYHMTEDIWQADLEDYVAGRHVGLMWASPDCTHFSRAKGVKQALCAPYITEFYGTSVASGAAAPLHTITTSAGHFGVVRAELSRDMGRWPEVRALLNEHCGYRLRDDEVLVTWIGGAPHYISDIGLRMLTPQELKLAQGFPTDYIIDRYYDGTPVTKTQQVRMIGNSVVPIMARKLVAANLGAA